MPDVLSREWRLSKTAKQQLLDRAAVMKLAQVGWKPAAIAKELALKPTFVYKWADRSKSASSVMDALVVEAEEGHKEAIKVVTLMEGKKSRSVRRVAKLLSDTGVSVGRETVWRIAHAAELSPQPRR
jgi:transposase